MQTNQLFGTNSSENLFSVDMKNLLWQFYTYYNNLNCMFLSDKFMLRFDVLNKIFVQDKEDKFEVNKW